MYLYLTEARDTSFNDPITKYVPELATCVTENAAELAWDAIGIINWDSMTVGPLARHLADVPRGAAPRPAPDQLVAEFTGLAPASAQFCGNPTIVQLPCNRTCTPFPENTLCLSMLLYFSVFFHPIQPLQLSPIRNRAASVCTLQ